MKAIEHKFPVGAVYYAVQGGSNFWGYAMKSYSVAINK